MKYYKVIFKTNVYPYTYAEYYKNESEAKEAVESPATQATFADPCCVEVTYHHTARALGYVGVHGEYVTYYKGRYGEGFVKHLPSGKSSRYSRYYHDIEYYIES